MLKISRRLRSGDETGVDGACPIGEEEKNKDNVKRSVFVRYVFILAHGTLELERHHIVHRFFFNVFTRQRVKRVSSPQDGRGGLLTCGLVHRSLI